MKTTQCLTTLNQGEPNRLADALRALTLAGYETTKDKATVSFGDLMNKIIALTNQGSNSVAASQTVTIATPNVADTVTVTVDTIVYGPYAIADATSATTAATGIKNLMNADASLAKRFVATNAAGVITLTSNRKGAGMNAAAISTAVIGAGGTTSTRGAATFAGGTLLDDILPIVDVG